jgi:hypothetical protein
MAHINFPEMWEFLRANPDFCRTFYISAESGDFAEVVSPDAFKVAASNTWMLSEYLQQTKYADSDQTISGTVLCDLVHLSLSFLALFK